MENGRSSPRSVASTRSHRPMSNSIRDFDPWRHYNFLGMNEANNRNGRMMTNTNNKNNENRRISMSHHATPIRSGFGRASSVSNDMRGYRSHRPATARANGSMYGSAGPTNVRHLHTLHARQQQRRPIMRGNRRKKTSFGGITSHSKPVLSHTSSLVNSTGVSPNINNIKHFGRENGRILGNNNDIMNESTQSAMKESVKPKIIGRKRRSMENDWMEEAGDESEFDEMSSHYGPPRAKRARGVRVQLCYVDEVTGEFIRMVDGPPNGMINSTRFVSSGRHRMNNNNNNNNINNINANVKNGVKMSLFGGKKPSLGKASTLPMNVSSIMEEESIIENNNNNNNNNNANEFNVRDEIRIRAKPMSARKSRGEARVRIRTRNEFSTGFFFKYLFFFLCFC